MKYKHISAHLRGPMTSEEHIVTNNQKGGANDLTFFIHTKLRKSRNNQMEIRLDVKQAKTLLCFGVYHSFLSRFCQCKTIYVTITIH